MDVAQPTRGDQHDGVDHRIRRRHPEHRLQAGGQVGDQVGDRDVDDRDVQQRHEQAEAEHGEEQAGADRPVPVDRHAVDRPSPGPLLSRVRGAEGHRLIDRRLVDRHRRSPFHPEPRSRGEHLAVRFRFRASPAGAVRPIPVPPIPVAPIPVAPIPIPVRARPLRAGAGKFACLALDRRRPRGDPFVVPVEAAVGEVRDDRLDPSELRLEHRQPVFVLNTEDPWELETDGQVLPDRLQRGDLRPEFDGAPGQLAQHLARGDQRQERQGRGELRVFVAGRRQHVQQPVVGGLPALRGEPIHRALGAPTLPGGLHRLDESGRDQALDHRVERPALDVDHLTLAPPVVDPLHLVGVHRAFREQPQHHQRERRRLGRAFGSTATSHTMTITHLTARCKPSAKTGPGLAHPRCGVLPSSHRSFSGTMAEWQPYLPEGSAFR